MPSLYDDKSAMLYALRSVKIFFFIKPLKCKPNKCIFNPLYYGVHVNLIHIKNIILAILVCVSIATDMKYQKMHGPQYTKAAIP